MPDKEPEKPNSHLNEILEHLFNSLEKDQFFPEENLLRLKSLYKSGDLGNSDKLLKALKTQKGSK